eukprot:jgi/Chlat1/6432/Chrsp45S05946
MQGAAAVVRRGRVGALAVRLLAQARGPALSEPCSLRSSLAGSAGLGHAGGEQTQAPAGMSSDNSVQHRQGVAISVEGNIGVGKSTLLRLAQASKDLGSAVVLCPEPIEHWQNVNGTGQNMLDAFYKDPHRYSYLFQSYVFITRFLQHHSAAQAHGKPGTVRLLERSVFTDRAIFQAAAAETGMMTKLEVAAYDFWFDSVVSVLPNLVPDAFVYMRATPSVCHQRLKSRARSEEVGVTLDYLQLIHEKHERWFVHGTDPAPSHGESNEHTRTAPAGARASVRWRVLNGERCHPLLHGKPVLIIDCEPHIEALDIGSVAGDSLVHNMSQFFREMKLV